MTRIYYDKFSKFKNCISFDELVGSKIKEFKIQKDNTQLLIKTNNLDFILDGYSTCGYDSYIENDLKELNKLVGKNIIKAEIVAEDFSNYDLLFFYNIETRDSFVQIRFIGKDDTYYASQVEVLRTHTEDEINYKIKKAENTISEIKKDISFMKNII